MLTRRGRLSAPVLTAMLMAFAAALLAAEREPVIAVTPFRQSFDQWKGWDRQLLTVRDQVVSELSRNYACVILNRSHGYSLALEDAVKRLGAITEPTAAPPAFYCADYSFTGYFQVGVKGVECVLTFADLREKAPKESLRSVVVSAPSVDASAPAVAAAIAQAAALDRRAAAKPSSPDVAHTWIVLPPVVLGSQKEGPGEAEALPKNLSLRMEAALQQNPRVKLVDHTAIDAVLKEQALATLDASGYGTVCRLAGAERALLASASAEKDDALHVELLAVDAATAQIVAASTLKGVPRADAGDAVASAVQALLEAVRPPVPLASADAAQREREARLYLASAKSDSRSNALSAQLAAIEYAEMVYLVARDNPAVVCDMSRLLCKACRFSASMSKTVRGRVAEIADKIVGPCGDLADVPDLLLARAQAYAAGGEYESAHRLIVRFTKAYPGRVDKDVRNVLGECLLEMGRPREALEAIGADNQDYQAPDLRIRANRMLRDDAGAFAVMEKMSPYKLKGRTDEFFTLLAKVKGPQAVVDYVRQCISRDKSFATENMMQYHHAVNLLATGDRKGAAELCQRLLDVGKANNWVYFDAGDNKVFRQKLEALQAQTGPSGEVWLKACEVQPVPASCALYLQPLGALDTNLLEKVRSGVQTFFGARTEILPALELTHQERSYLKESNKYNVLQLIPDQLKRLKVPSDALAVVMITRENMRDDAYTWVNYRMLGLGIVISYHVWQREKEIVRTILLRNTAIKTISNQLGVKSLYPCITGWTHDCLSARMMKFAYSPEAQEQYKKLDLAAEQGKVIEQFRKAGSTVVAKP